MFSVRKNFRKIMFLALSAATVFMAACNKDDDNPTIPSPVTIYGDSIKIGNGIARSYIRSNVSGQPESIGFILSEAGLDGLPVHDTVYTLHLPSNNKTLTDHISINYSAHGHEPAGVYDVSHFDVHFYNITEQAQNAITEADPKSEVLPPVVYWPKDYVPGNAVAKMGKHWVDTTSAELHGKPFTQTLIYGSYNGKFIFQEPMIAINYLKTKPNTSNNIKPLGKIQDVGYYPDSYSLLWEKEKKQYIVSMDQLTYLSK